MYALYVGNKNYSSWSLRPWALLTELAIPFEERFQRFEGNGSPGFKKFSPSGRVPCLVDGDTVVWDSLAIAEYVAEDHPRVWSEERRARAFARSAAAEMHSSFFELRNRCSMSVGVRIQLHEHPPALQRDLDRIAALWQDGLARFGGPFLAGSRFTAVDAFYAPVAFRLQTYGLSLGGAAEAYAKRLLALGACRRWEADALAEDFRDVGHEGEILASGKLLKDLRVPAAR
ncbi:MAG: glutathione S-transferase family protein [Anaeromyxobacter sp.]